MRARTSLFFFFFRWKKNSSAKFSSCVFSGIMASSSFHSHSLRTCAFSFSLFCVSFAPSPQTQINPKILQSDGEQLTKRYWDCDCENLRPPRSPLSLSLSCVCSCANRENCPGGEKGKAKEKRKSWTMMLHLVYTFRSVCDYWMFAIECQFDVGENDEAGALCWTHPHDGVRVYIVVVCSLQPHITAKGSHKNPSHIMQTEHSTKPQEFLIWSREFFFLSFFSENKWNYLSTFPSFLDLSPSHTFCLPWRMSLSWIWHSEIIWKSSLSTSISISSDFILYATATPFFSSSIWWKIEI